MKKVCRCGHPHAAHEHFDPVRTNCAFCPSCLRYRPRRWWHLPSWPRIDHDDQEVDDIVTTRDNALRKEWL